MRILPTALLVLALLPSAADARSRTAPIKDPVTVQAAAGVSARDFQVATALAVLNRGWAIENKQGGKFEAVYAQEGRRRSFSARIKVSVTGTTAKIEYVSSEGLGYQDGEINANYNKWMDYLEQDIPTFVNWLKIASK